MTRPDDTPDAGDNLDTPEAAARRLARDAAAPGCACAGLCDCAAPVERPGAVCPRCLDGWHVFPALTLAGRPR